MKTWIIGDNGNRASIQRWGSEDAARESLSKLTDCYDCYDFSRCVRLLRLLRLLRLQVPVIEDIHRKIYDAASQPNALNMREFHSCETTHCRAGWAVHIAGPAGYALEKKTSALFAAQQIYKASGYEISPVRFFEDDATAMADMRRLAEEVSSA